MNINYNSLYKYHLKSHFLKIFYRADNLCIIINKCYISLIDNQQKVKAMKIRRNLFIAFLLCMNVSFAQKSNEIEITTFKPHYFLQVQGGVSNTVGEVKFSDLLSPAVAANLGYKFNPIFALRAGASAWQAKGGWVTPKVVYKYNFVQGNVDALFDLSTLLCSYNPERVFNGYGFIGAGVNFASNNDEANELYKEGYDLKNIWDGHKTLLVGRAGLGANIRLSKVVYFNLEANANILSDKYNSKKADNPDWQFNALAGFTFKFGQSSKKTVVEEPVYSEPVAPVQPVVVEKKPAPVVEEKKVEKQEALTENIFFVINSSKIRTSEMSKIDALVDYMNKYPEAKVAVTGYADKGTGTAAINNRISQKRADSVAKALMNKGIKADRINVSSKGDTVQPFAENDLNRVVICIAE